MWFGKNLYLQEPLGYKEGKEHSDEDEYQASDRVKYEHGYFFTKRVCNRDDGGYADDVQDFKDEESQGK